MIAISSLVRDTRKQGFTVVELTIVIVVIAILASIVILSYGAWRQTVSESVVKSDIAAAATAMKHELNHNDEYPAALPATVVPSEDVTMTMEYSLPSEGKFCIQASHPDGGVYHITEKSGVNPEEGECPAGLPSNAAATTVVAEKITGMNIRGTASAITCTVGTPQYRLSHRINTNAWQTGSWGTTLTRTATYTATSPPPNAVWTYTFKAETRCVFEGIYGIEATSPVSNGVVVTGFICPSGNAVYSGGGWICGAG